MLPLPPLSSEKHKMTINAKSYEFLDFCGELIGDPAEISKELTQNVTELPDSYGNVIDHYKLWEEVRKIKYEFVEQYAEEKDYSALKTKYIPKIIAPTENDWQHPSHLNWILKEGLDKVRITAKNTKPIEYNITILEKAEEGNIIKVDGLAKPRSKDKLKNKKEKVY